MSTITMNAAKDATHDAMNAAKDVTQGAVKGVKSSVLDALKSVSEVLGFVRSLGIADALGVVGLSRRPSALAGIGVFASGVVVGAGLGMLVAPMSGAETRAFLRGRLSASKAAVTAAAMSAEKKVEAVVAAEVKQANGTLEHLAEIVENKAKSMAHKSS